MPKIRQSLLLIALFTVLLIPFSARAEIGTALGLSPFWDWKTIETEHFRLTFPKELAESAQKSAAYLEEANTALAAKLLWQPIHKTQILLIDNADAANGLTSAIARFGIVLYITPPDNWFSTQYYDDWLRLLCFHEYTHMVNMDTTTSFYALLRYAVGDILLPNAIWPTWMLEGLAVYMETRYTGAGRGRSPYYEMILRSAVAEGVLDNTRFITLDKVNGPNPYFPFGETVYLFGYELMNQVAREPVEKKSYDRFSLIPQGSPSHPGENMLGEMSFRSSRRIPFFINGNLENISGKDWYAFWDEWVEETRERQLKDLKKIRSQPVTRFERITEGGGQTLGSAFSADGKWVAYTRETPDDSTALWIQDRPKNPKDAKVRQVYDKIFGATLAFTPDSKHVVFSTLNRKGVYYLWSDLKAYSLDENSSYTLTDSLRARDPDVSRDGKWIAFTLARNASTELVIAPLLQDGKRVKLGEVKTIFTPPKYDAVYTPKFSSDGNRIYFSWHHNGKASEEIAVFDRVAQKASILVSNGKMNRYPAVKPTDAGDELYFSSDLTGVNNLYLYRQSKPTMVTNTTTGFSFPTFDEKGNLFANVFSPTGWNIAKVHPKVVNSPESVAVSPPPFPPGGESIPEVKVENLKIEDYSIIPSIWPRQWLPVFLWNPKGSYLGGQVLGFDAVDLHEYILGVAYNFFVDAPDILALYSNRMLGATLTFGVQSYTSDISSNAQTGDLISYERNIVYSADARFPIKWTYSSLTPSISLYEDRNFLKVPTSTGDSTIAASYWVPYVDTKLYFTQSNNSELAITTEDGRVSQIGSRVYLNSGKTFLKVFASDTEYWRTDFLTEHSVLVPSLNYQWVDRGTSTGYLDTNVTVEGRQSGRLINTFPPDSLDQLTIRGYPLQTFYSKQAAVASLDYRFPLWRIFRGWGTNPAFLENLKGFVFGESAYFPNGTRVKALPSAGGGIQLETTLLNSLPLTASTEYHKGFREDFGGTGELFFQINVNTSIPY